MACDPEVVGRHILINLNPSGIASSGHNIPRNINVMPSFFSTVHWLELRVGYET